jgi:hypothetical protein
MAYKRAGAQTLTSSTTNPVVSVPAFITATSTGTVTTVGNYTVHTFLSSGTFTVTAGVNKAIEYLIIAGGGGGGGDMPGTNSHLGGGGAGGFLESYAAQTVGADFSGARIYVNSSDVFTVTVGAGGAKGTGSNKGSNGGNSSIVKSGSYSVTSIGGGGGARASTAAGDPGSGGSSGGHGYSSGTWIGNPAESVISPRQGYRAWSTNYSQQTVCGGGAGGNGDINVPPSSGAPGRASSISGSSVTYSASNASDTSGTAINGATNKGDGGGGASQSSGLSGAGGSGIVIIRYLFQ